MQKVKRSKMCSSSDPSLFPIAELLGDIEKLSTPPSKKFHPCFNIPVKFSLQVEDQSDDDIIANEFAYYDKVLTSELLISAAANGWQPWSDHIHQYYRLRTVHGMASVSRYDISIDSWADSRSINLLINRTDPIFEDPYTLLPESIRKFATLHIDPKLRRRIWNHAHKILSWMSNMGYDDPMWTHQLCKSALALVSINTAEEPGKDWEVIEISKMREEVQLLFRMADAMHRIYG